MERLPAIQDVQSVAEVFMASGMFQDVKDVSQAMVKIMAGQEIGLPPVASLRSIDLIEGQIQVRSHAIAALIKKAGYDYLVMESTDQRCVIVYYLRDGRKATAAMTRAEADRAGFSKRRDGKTKQMWEKLPAEMLYARTMAKGARQHCADAVMGGVYVEGEIEQEEPRTLEDITPEDLVVKATSPADDVIEEPCSDKQRSYTLGLLKKYGVMEGYKRRVFDLALPAGNKRLLHAVIEEFDIADRIPDVLFGAYVQILREEQGVERDQVRQWIMDGFNKSSIKLLTHEEQMQLVGWIQYKTESEPEAKPEPQPAQQGMGLKMDWEPQIKFYAGSLNIPEADVRGWFNTAFDGIADDEITDVLGKFDPKEMRKEIETFIESVTGHL